MAGAVSEAIAGRRNLIAEAETGIGKTFAYLIPALLSGRRVVISTGTRNLQDQLYEKDLPTVKRALAVPCRTALLKGRANYLCPYRFKSTLSFQAGYGLQDAADIESLTRWSKTTRTGDRKEVADVPDSSALWRSVTSTSENCLGSECPEYDDCYLAAARRNAFEADVIVVNHHVLWAHLVLQDEGLGELLPKPEVVIVDEAHQFADSAAQFLGISVGSRQIEELVRDIRSEIRHGDGEIAALVPTIERLEQSSADLGDAFGDGAERQPWEPEEEHAESVVRLHRLAEALTALSLDLGSVAEEYGKGILSCRQRSLDLAQNLLQFAGTADDGFVSWLERQPHAFRLNRTPIEMGDDRSGHHFGGDTCWIFTSATLSNAGRFDHFRTQLGLSEADTFRVESPFDYARQCLLYAPPGLPDPSSHEYNAAIVAAAAPVFVASGGRGFFLFTSHRALREAAGFLREQTSFPLFVQGSSPNSVLLELFRRSGNGILLGTSSFWEGVDVRGPALSCVVIDRLPFASPADPVLAARIASLKRKGHSPFRELQLPTAILSLKQGVGRLIRDADDRGVLMICDPRLFTRPYGKNFLANLPPAPVTRSVRDVESFFSTASPDDPERACA
jgi:ATP-dependent DNA helicase DinG